jgi:protein-S-isoprenylcysteine O-methyltransferase Ste14
MPDLTVLRVYLLLWGCLTLAIRTFFVRRAGRRKAQAGGATINPHPLVVGSMALWVILITAFTALPEFFLNGRFMIYRPVPAVLQMLGMIGLAGGLWLFLGAHQALGEFYGVKLFVKESHRVIDSGPYAYIRHPMYTIYMSWIVSTLLFLPHYTVPVLFLMALTGFSLMAKREEHMLCKALGEPYETYLKRTGMFLPKW